MERVRSRDYILAIVTGLSVAAGLSAFPKKLQLPVGVALTVTLAVVASFQARSEP